MRDDIEVGILATRKTKTTDLISLARRLFVSSGIDREGEVGREGKMNAVKERRQKLRGREGKGPKGRDDSEPAVETRASAGEERKVSEQRREEAEGQQRRSKEGKGPKGRENCEPAVETTTSTREERKASKQAAENSDFLTYLIKNPKNLGKTVFFIDPVGEQSKLLTTAKKREQLTEIHRIPSFHRRSTQCSAWKKSFQRELPHLRHKRYMEL
ncbi:hypothetical protein ACLOJK_006211 [Asimina triloba]